MTMSMLLTLLPIPAMAKEPAAVSPFEDVAATDWYYEAACYVKEQGLMQGTDATHFSPDMVLTRGMIVTILHQMDGAAAVSGAPFPDVAESAYYAVPIAWAAEKGIVSGYPDGCFGPDDPITRQQLVTILHHFATYRGLSCPAGGTLDGFSDAAQAAEYALSALRWALETGLISGTSKTTLSPLGGATRAQAAVILMRLADLLDEPEPPVKRPGSTHSGSGGSEKPPVPEKPEPEEPKPESPEDVLSKGGYVYAITSLTVEGSAAVAKISTQEACTLTVTILDQDTKEPVSVSKRAAAQLEMEDLPISLTSAPPKYFIVQAALTDDTGKLLCDPLISMRYTKEQEKFDDLTVQDFPKEIVVNFDDDPTDNFGVLAEGAVEMDSDDGVAVVKDNGTVEIFNASEEIRSLKEGNVLYFPSAEDPDDALVKVGEIRTEGKTVLIVPEEEAYLSDFYRLLKVDMSFGKEELEEALKAETPAPAPLAAPAVFSAAALYSDPILDGVDTEYKFLFDTEKLIDSGVKSPARIKIEGAMMTTVKIEYDVELFGPDYIYQEVMTEVAATGMIGLSAGDSSSDFPFTRFDFVNVPIPINIPGATVYIKAGAAFDFECEASIDATSRLYFKAGFIHDGNGNVQTINKKNVEFNPKLNGNGKAEFSIGPSAELGLQFCKDILNVGINAGVSLHAEAENDATAGQVTANAEDVHGCTDCFKGRLGPKLSLELTGRYELSEKRRGQFLKIESAALFGEGDFFFSAANEADSLYLGLPHFGMGECQNHKYLVGFTVLDPDKQSLSTEVTVKKEPSTTSTVKAPGKGYFYNGSYLAEAAFQGKSKQVAFTIDGKGTSVVIEFQNPSVRGAVTRKSADGTTEPLAGVTVEFFNAGGQLVRTSITTSAGFYLAENLKPGNYQVTFTKSGYETKTASITLEMTSQKLDVTLTELSKGTVAGRVTDAETGKPVSNAMVRIIDKNSGKEVYSKRADVNGLYSAELGAGTYTIEASAASYANNTAEVVVTPEQRVTMDMSLRKNRYTLSGMITEANSDPVKYISDAAVSVSENGKELGSTTTDKNGHYSLLLPAGTYTVKVSATDYEDEFASVTVTASGGTLNMALKKPSGNICGDNLYWKLENGVLTIYGEGPMYNYHGSDSPFYPIKDQITSVVVTEGTTYIGDCAFSFNPTLTSVTFDCPLEKIGSNSFQGATNLKAVHIPDTVTAIDRWAFHGCKGLVEVTLGKNLETIGEGAFETCSRITEISIPGSVKSIASEAFRECYSLGKVTLNEGLTQIDRYVFLDCRNLTSINIPESVTKMGESVFLRCESLTDVDWRAKLTYIPAGTFSACTKLSKFDIPDNITVIQDSAFGSSGLTSIEIPDSVVKIEKTAFSNTPLTHVQFSTGLQEIGSRAFSYCQSLAGEIVLPDSVEKIGERVFEMSRISKIEMKSAVEDIHIQAFSGMNYMQTIIYAGSKEEFDAALRFSDPNAEELYAGLKGKTIHCKDCTFTA